MIPEGNPKCISWSAKAKSVGSFSCALGPCAPIAEKAGLCLIRQQSIASCCYKNINQPNKPPPSKTEQKLGVGYCLSSLKLGRWSRLCMPVSCVWMALPSQAGKPQGHYIVKWNVLVDNVSGTGRGWQQSRSNWTLLAVAGYWARVHVAKQPVTTSFCFSLLF